MTAFTAADWSIVKNTRRTRLNTKSQSVVIFYQLGRSNKLNLAPDHDFIVAIISQKRRSLRLKINDQGEAELYCPIGLKNQLIKEFLAQHTQWLIEQYRSVKQRLDRSQYQIPIYGEDYQLQIIEFESTSDQFNHRDKLTLDHKQKLCRLKIANHNSKIVVEERLISKTESSVGLNPLQKKQLFDALRQYAKPVFQQCIDRWWPVYQEISQDFTTSKPTLRVKKMKTRWGSLSQRGYINLNLALIHYPPSVLDMVVVHELSHCRYFNHSAHFYRLMTAIKPDWRNDEVHLKNSKYRYI